MKIRYLSALTAIFAVGTGFWFFIAQAENISILDRSNGERNSDGSGEEVTDDEQIENSEIAKETQLEMKKTGVFWKAPDFSKQNSALGWDDSTFQPPPGFKQRVQFWVDVYTKYSTSQAIIHDSKYLDLIYKILDFSQIESDPELDARQKHRAKERLVKKEKADIREALMRIHKSENSPSKLSPEDLVIYNKFKYIDEKNRFYEASHRSRLRMQLGQSDRFKLGIYFSGRYLPEMEKIFREEGVPIELTRLPFVESSFNPYAMSKVRASGIWQFMPRTGRLFKLKIDAVRDMRNDPLIATRAAAKMLRSNFEMLGSWPLALTAYNHGPAGVARQVKLQKTRDINAIVWNSTGRRFGFASENFYAEFLAAVIVESQAEKFFGKLEVCAPLVYDEIELPRAVRFSELARVIGEEVKVSDPYESARLLNPYFTRPIMSGSRKIPEKYVVRINRGFGDKVLARLRDYRDSGIKEPKEVKSGEYRIQPGDTITSIGKDFGVSTKELIEMNGLDSESILRPGQKILVPGVE